MSMGKLVVILLAALLLKTRGGSLRSHDHALPDRLFRSLPAVPGAGAGSAGQTSPGGGRQCSPRILPRGEPQEGMVTDGLAAK
jgi:hypothetical protein